MEANKKEYLKKSFPLNPYPQQRPLFNMTVCLKDLESELNKLKEFNKDFNENKTEIGFKITNMVVILETIEEDLETYKKIATSNGVTL